MTKLYKLDSKSKMRVWEAVIYEDGYEVLHGVLGGTMQEKWTDVCEGKVNRTIDEQIKLEVVSLMKKKMDRGYSMTIEEAKKGPTNSLGLQMPMLGLPLKDIKDFDPSDGYWMQYKYNGHRCMVTKQKGELIAYSKTGQLINSVGHILEELRWLEEGSTLDGELYHHGTKINRISSLVRKPQEDSKKLIYVIYDTVMQEPYSTRFDFLSRKLGPLGSSVLAPTRRLENGHNGITKQLSHVLDLKYEGLMLRKEDCPYEAGKRSKSLIKVKQWMTREYPVSAINASKDGWAVLTCVVSDTDDYIITVDVSAPGTHEEKTEVYKNKDKYLGRLIQLQFAELTEFGIPFHPVAVYWRDLE